MRSFGSFFERSEVPAIRSVLDDLFLNVCGSWYQNRSRLPRLDLKDHYLDLLHLQRTNIRTIDIDGIQRSEDGNLSFDEILSNLEFKDPWDRIFTHSFYLSAPYGCTTHGNLTIDNILVTSSGRACLIDFCRTGISHFLRDIAALETAIRIQLLAPNEASLAERWDLEKIFHGGAGGLSALAEKLNDKPRSIRKTVLAVVHLRGLAQKLTEGTYSSWSGSYEMNLALLFHALHFADSAELPPLQRKHALLSACLLADLVETAQEEMVLHLEGAIDALREENVRMLDAVSIVAHELRGPLATAISFLEDDYIDRIRNPADGGKSGENVKSAIGVLRSSFDTIQRILTVANIEQGQLSPVFECCDFVLCIKEAIEQCDAYLKISKKNIAFKKTLPSDAISLNADSFQLTRVVYNLVENAIKFTDKGEVRLSCWVEQDSVYLLVEDTGKGIEPDFLPYVFEKFRQGSGSRKTRPQGCGIGLYIANHHVVSHGGKLEILKSSLGGGTTVRIAIPIREARG